MSEQKPNLLEKLGKSRIDFQAAEIKKTGKNSYVGFDYYELHDILPKINELSLQYRFICAVSFNSEMATLTITDIDDKAQTVTFTSPMADVNLKGAHSIQNLGAVQTYMRRYLYMIAFEIVECDSFDGSMGSKDSNKSEKPTTALKNNNGVSNQPQSQAPKPQNKTPPIIEKDAIGKTIGEILKTLNQDGLSLFTKEEIEAERNIFYHGNTQAVKVQYDRLKKELEKRIAAYVPIPFEDDYPFEQEEPEIF